MSRALFLNNPKRAPGVDKNTFLVRIEHNRNGTWQGKVIWAEGNRTARFRSALELVKLLDEALTEEREVKACLRSGTDF